jgi:hypothetical protein
MQQEFKGGLDAPVCLTWEWTDVCKLCDSSPLAGTS